MSKLVVADAGPLIALGKLDHIHLLSLLFDRALVPEAVIAECLDDMRLPGALAVRRALASKLLHRVADSKGLTEELPGLDIGERAATLAAQQLKATLLIDEKRGRNVARRLRVPVVGTLGIIVLARQQSLVSEARPLLTSLKAGGYYISEELLKTALRLCGE